MLRRAGAHAALLALAMVVLAAMFARTARAGDSLPGREGGSQRYLLERPRLQSPSADSLTYLPLVFDFVSGRLPKTIYGRLNHDGLAREYILYVPATIAGASSIPLLLSFHAYARDATVQMNYADFRPLADGAGFIIAHPQGTTREGSDAAYWNVGGYYTGSADDVGFTAALIDSISNSFAIDPDRVYAAGFSNGAYMAHLLGCQLSDRIAAIAAVAATMTPETIAACDPQHPMPVLQIHGTEDAVVPYQGDAMSLSVDNALDYWVSANNADPSPIISALPDIDESDGSTVEHFVYGDGDNGVTVELFKVTGGGHTWPGSAVHEPGTNYDIDAAAEIWSYFAEYDISGRIR